MLVDRLPREGLFLMALSHDGLVWNPLPRGTTVSSSIDSRKIPGFLPLYYSYSMPLRSTVFSGTGNCSSIAQVSAYFNFRDYRQRSETLHC